MAHTKSHSKWTTESSLLILDLCRADHEPVHECREGNYKMEEEHLKKMNPNSPSIARGISPLFAFMDDLADPICLVY
uniref:Enhancer of rudimentary homolog n=2 Tax=Sus scrofa TaxID=9823 RepID=A0A8W4FCJ1_PIG